MRIAQRSSRWPVPSDSTKARGILAQRLQHQASWCDDLGSPMYAQLLRSAADDLNAEGAVWRVLAGFEEEDSHAAIALRLMGALHRLTLMGSLPALATHYPSTDGDGDAHAAWLAFRDALVAQRSQIRELLPRGRPTGLLANGTWRAVVRGEADPVARS
jgi:hypothetical protein